MTQPSASSPETQPGFGQNAAGSAHPPASHGAQPPYAAPQQPNNQQPSSQQPNNQQPGNQQPGSHQPGSQQQGAPHYGAPGYPAPSQASQGYGGSGNPSGGAPQAQFQESKQSSGLFSTDFSRTTTGPTAKLAYTMILILAGLIAFDGLISGIQMFTYFPYGGSASGLQVIDGLITIIKGVVLAMVVVTVGRLVIEHFVHAAKKN